MAALLKRRGLRSLFARRDGAAAVEFSLVAIPFFWMLIGMAEFGAMSLVQTNLDNALAETGREIRTGIAQSEGMSKVEMEAELCERLNEIMALTCANNLFLDVDRYDSFSTVGNGTPTNNGAIDPTQLNYTPGAGDEVILVRAYYQWQILTPLFGSIFANMEDGKRLMVSSMLFRNEPF
ncbi:MAG: TadE/TadG family type IV pilus assembly protein [Hyphomonadaceae bacterium]|nr:TadE/TadG family type IV pilus assembly protein [Hyphomonadaceae bacterium]